MCSCDPWSSAYSATVKTDGCRYWWCVRIYIHARVTDRKLLQPRVHCPQKGSKHGFGLLDCSKGRPTSLSDPKIDWLVLNLFQQQVTCRKNCRKWKTQPLRRLTCTMHIIQPLQRINFRHYLQLNWYPAYPVVGINGDVPSILKNKLLRGDTVLCNGFSFKFQIWK